jgi:predicted enzyme related to lactoylglutathione lyase
MRVRGYPAGVPCWADVSTPDLDSTRSFYSSLFGWTLVPASVDWYAMFYLGDRAVGGIRHASSAAWLPYVATDDVDATVDAVHDNGGTALMKPSELTDAARIAVVSDPSGATLGLWQRRRFAGAQAVNEFGTVSWAELATRTADSASAFYGPVFGWEDRPALTLAGTPYTEWYSGDRYIAGMVQMDERWPDRVPPHWTVSVLVESCGDTADRAGQLGGRVLLPPTDLGPARYAQLADPHGAGFRVIELVPQLLAAL